MKPLFLTQPACAVVFWTVYLIWVVPEVLQGWTRRSPAEAQKRDRGSLQVLMASVAVGIFLGMLAALRAPWAALPGRGVLFGVGIALMLAGIFLRQWAIRTLGRYFTFDVAVRTLQPVVETGPYRYVRHPGYSGALLTIFGFGLTLANWLSLAAFLLGVAVGCAYRVPVEERALCEGLGQPYADYMQRTPRFFPHIVWRSTNGE